MSFDGPGEFLCNIGEFRRKWRITCVNMRYDGKKEVFANKKFGSAIFIETTQ